MPEKQSDDRETQRIRTLAKPAVYCLILVIISLNIVFRYPLNVSHEMGSDTTFIHTLSSSLSQEGFARWYINPFSFFGLFALSYPSATPVLLATLSQLSGISIEGLILLMGMAFGIIGALSAFVVAREILDDDRFALLVAILFSLAPFFLKDTTWIGSSRGFVVAMLPVLVMLLVKHLKTGNTKYLALAIVVFIIVCSLHRMGFLATFLFIAFAFIPSFHRLTQRIRFSLAKYEVVFRLLSVGLALFGFLFIFLLQIALPGYGGFDIRDEYSKGTFLEGDSVLVLLVNMGVNFTGKVGLLMPLTLLGLAMYSWKRPKNIRDKFVLLLVFILIPFLSLRDYISEFMILFFVFLVVFAIIRISVRLPRKSILSVLVISSVLISSIGFSWYMKDWWRNRYATDDQIPEDIFDTAIYVHHYTDGIILANDGLMGGRISAISGRATLPLGGASTHWFTAQQLIFETEDSDNLIFMPVESIQVHRLNIEEITFNTDEIFLATNIPNALRDWEKIMYDRPERDEMLGLYGIEYCVIHLDYPHGFISYTYRYSAYLAILDASRYKVFENGETMIRRI